MLAKLFCKREMLIIGKEEPDPDWEGIDGLRYIQTSEFNVQLAYLPEINDISERSNSNKSTPRVAKQIYTVVQDAPTFKKVAVKKKIDNVEIDPKAKDTIQKPEPASVTARTQIPPTNKIEKELEPSSRSQNVFGEGPIKEIIQGEEQNKDGMPEKSFVKNNPGDDLDSINSDNDDTKDNVFGELFEKYSFSREEKPAERSVRYSQNAHLANALY